MQSVGETEITNSGSPLGLSTQDIDAILAEAMAVDVLLQQRPRPYDVVLALSAYLTFRQRGDASIADPD